MAQDFYTKAQALQEEFQKRELHYQNMERELQSNIMREKELNVPLQEYLQKINQREKETEETARNIMKQMDILDRQADSMMLKFEKMEFLKNSLINFSIPSWPSDVVNRQIFNTSQNFNSNIQDSRLQSVESSFISTVERNLKSTSIQTENLYCEECGFLIQSNPRRKKDLETSSSILSKIQSDVQDLHSINCRSNLYGLQEVQSTSEFVASSVNSNLNTVPVNIEKSNALQSITTSFNSNLAAIPVNVAAGFVDENFKSEQVNKNSHDQNFNQKLHERFGSVEDRVESNNAMAVNKPDAQNSIAYVKELDNSVESNINRETVNRSLNERSNIPENLAEFNKIRQDSEADNSKNEKKMIESQNSENEIYESKSETEINIDTFGLKSDAESMNNEFDFLETDAQNKSSKIVIQDYSKDYKPSSSNVSTKNEKVPNSVVDSSNKNSAKQEKIRKTIKPDLNLDLEDERSETSGNVSSPHSPNLSLASDSDSFYRKESPLKASAAYQALLGNTITPNAMKKDVSDSESEDEVESALATVVQKTNVRPKSSIQPKKDKPVPQIDEPKPPVKKSQLPSGNKPQSKLSKSTRKVLGLDTSSGSEVELTLKPPEKKIDDDSDEFFYG